MISTPFGKSLRDSLAFVLALIFFSACGLKADTTNALSEAEIQGRTLAQKILEQRPAENSTNTGTLIIHAAGGQRLRLPVTCETAVTETNWLNRYVARWGTNAMEVTTLTITHSGAEPNQYLLNGPADKAALDGANRPVGMAVSGNQTMIPFAGSDFWLCDFGLEFFHWPQQKVVKKEFCDNCACAVLESTNPNPSTNGYARVVCWIDEDSLGIVKAYAYARPKDVRELKNFHPKDLEKVHGQYQVGSMVMENRQTDSTSRLEFNLNK